MSYNHNDTFDQAFYRLLFEKAPDSIILVDTGRRLVQANQAARELALDIGALLSDRRLDEFFATLDTFGNAAAEVHAVDRSGHGRVVALRGRTLPTNLSAIVVHDVTARRELEGELARLRRLESLGLITASVVHDLNNMLTPILCLSSMVRAELDPASELAGHARDVHAAAERAAGLVRQVLAFVRRDPNRFAHADPSSILTELRPLVGRVVGEEVDVVLSLDQDAGEVIVDREQLEQVVLNLAANARDAMPRGGRLTLSTSALTLGDAEARVIECPGPGSYVAVTISDTGVGMSSETREQVFGVLFTTKAHGAGIGLGLATAHRFARQNGGCIQLQSAPGRGTTVTIYLPRVRGSQPDLTPQRETPLPRGSETLLIVDDDEGVVKTARAVLEEQGYRVETAHSGLEAVDVLKTKGCVVDLVLVDVVMPGMAGRELADTIARAGMRVKVLFMSGHADPKVRIAGIRYPHDPLLRKAFTPAELARKVREVLDS